MLDCNEVEEASIELTDKELSMVSGGDKFLNLDGIDGESKDTKHLNEIHIG